MGACVGFLLPVAGLFAFARLTAARRQRDEARAEVRRLTRPTDVEVIAVRKVLDSTGKTRSFEVDIR